MKKIGVLLSAGVGYLVTAGTALAQRPANESINIMPPIGKGINPLTPLSVIIKNVLTIVFVVAALAVLAMLIWGAFEWIFSGGDKDKVSNARKRITNALIGIAILALSFLIIAVVGQVLGVDITGNLYLPSIGQP